MRAKVLAVCVVFVLVIVTLGVDEWHVDSCLAHGGRWYDGHYER